MTELWLPGTTYAPGATVIASQTRTSAAPANASFAADLSGWNARPGWFARPGGGVNGGNHAALAKNAGTDVMLVNTHLVPVAAGQAITATCQVSYGNADDTDAKANVALVWYDAGRAPVHTDHGNEIIAINQGAWQKSTVTATAPSGAAFVAIAARGSNPSSKSTIRVDEFSWDYQDASAPPPLIFTATQAEPAKSGATEPTWPTAAGGTVTDGGVTWTASAMTAVTWTAAHLLQTGAAEPTWPTTVGESVIDNGITWICVTPQVTDPGCPQSRHVVIASSKVYAADKDTIRYSATVNPLDWSSSNDAGFLPFGLQTYGANPIEAMGLYRSNLVAFNAEGFQMWQVDEDPANSSLLDALPIGSTQHKALSPVSNDLFFLSAQGVRSMGIAAASVNLQAGDVGMPVDPLIQKAVAEAIADGFTPLATYYPGAGQYWLAIPERDVFF